MAKLYHGTNALFVKPSLDYCKEFKDFGKGFYVGDSREAAIKWATRPWMIGNYIRAFVYVFPVNLNELRHSFDVYQFRGTSLTWFDYILRNRTIAGGVPFDHDIVVGKIVDARAQQMINDFANMCGVSPWLADDFLKRSLMNKLGTLGLEDQYCFKSQRSLDYITRSMERYEVCENGVLRRL